IERLAVLAKRATAATSSADRGHTTAAGEGPSSEMREPRWARNASERYRGGTAAPMATAAAPRRPTRSSNVVTTGAQRTPAIQVARDVTRARDSTGCTPCGPASRMRCARGGPGSRNREPRSGLPHRTRRAATWLSWGFRVFVRGWSHRPFGPVLAHDSPTAGRETTSIGRNLGTRGDRSTAGDEDAPSRAAEGGSLNAKDPPPWRQDGLYYDYNQAVCLAADGRLREGNAFDPYVYGGNEVKHAVHVPGMDAVLARRETEEGTKSDDLL